MNDQKIEQLTLAVNRNTAALSLLGQEYYKVKDLTRRFSMTSTQLKHNCDRLGIHIVNGKLHVQQVITLQDRLRKEHYGEDVYYKG